MVVLLELCIPCFVPRWPKTLLELTQCAPFAQAASDGGLNIEPDAWQDAELSARLKQPFSKFPAQVRFT